MNCRIHKKIAFFSPAPFSTKLGATKNRIEFAEALQLIGWETFLVHREELVPRGRVGNRKAYNEGLKDFLQKNAHQFDVVIYEYNTLPYDRNLFSQKTLFVARPALLHYNYEHVRIPYDWTTRLKQGMQRLARLFSINQQHTVDQLHKWGERSLNECDVIQVQSNKDKQLLVAKGFTKHKILVVPNGLSGERLARFNANKSGRNLSPCIAFVGTFDYRKGALDFPFIIDQTLKRFPSCTFKFLGTKGLFPNEDAVLRFFPSRHRRQIQVVPQFEPLELPDLLSPCTIGIFPSYHESFGFGVLEMMAAGLPVVSYMVPGPSDFAIPELLVDIGDKKEMARKIAELLDDEHKIQHLSQLSRQIANQYGWETIAKQATEQYKFFIARKNAL